MEGEAVHRERRDREGPHRELHQTQQAHRVARGVGAAADPQCAECETEDERREHELERMRRAAEHEREHPDPGDLVDE